MRTNSHFSVTIRKAKTATSIATIGLLIASYGGSGEAFYNENGIDTGSVSSCYKIDPYPECLSTVLMTQETAE